ncbi:MAG: hypothetical protein HQ596_05665 [Candidatus Saganbacteria bacterium]|nr:hypothetical protein [Candidatus Saganbacteria bacterium]
MNKNQFDAFVLVVGRIASMLVAFVIVRVLTTILLPAEIGRMAIFMTILGFFGLFMISPIGNYVNRQIIGWEKKGLLKINLIYYIIYVFLVALFALFVLFLLKLFIPLAEGATNLWFATIIFLGIFVAALFSSFIGYINLFKRRFTFVILSNLAGWIGILSSALLTLAFARTAEFWMLGGFIAQFIIAVAALYILFKISRQSEVPEETKINFSFAKFRGALNFSLPLSLAVLFYWVQTQGYRFILQYKFGLETLGIFFINLNIGMQLTVAFETLFNQFYHPIYYNNISSPEVDKRVAAWNALGGAFLPALLMMLVFIGCSSIFLSRILVASLYWPFSYLIFFGALVEALRIISSVYSLAAHAEYKTKSLILPGLISAVVVVGLIYYLPGWNLYVGVASALVLGGLIGLVVLRAEIKKIVPIKFPLQRTLKASLFCLPMLLVFVFYFAMSLRAYYWNFVFLFILGAYFMLGQYLFARKWLKESL